MICESVASGTMFALGSGGFMAAFGLALGASNFEIGMLAAFPFLTQLLQLPAILAIVGCRRRKAIGLQSLAASFITWLPIGAIPFVVDVPGRPAPYPAFAAKRRMMPVANRVSNTRRSTTKSNPASASSKGPITVGRYSCTR